MKFVCFAINCDSLLPLQNENMIIGVCYFLCPLLKEIPLPFPVYRRFLSVTCLPNYKASFFSQLLETNLDWIVPILYTDEDGQMSDCDPNSNMWTINT